MRYQNVCLETVACVVPDEVVTSDEIERRLAPLYERLRLPAGRLELMTGIRERRFWPPGTQPSDKSIECAAQALDAAGIDRERIGALVHGSVCRDQLEPATACAVHRGLGLADHCLVYDVSNACLGILNGAVQVANMIELGQIEAGLVVGTESGRTLVESTIEFLNSATSLTRDQVKLAVASLTIGSASGAMLLVSRQLSRAQNRLLAAVARTRTDFVGLCQGGHNSESTAAPLLMHTDSERLLHAGIEVGAETFQAFLQETGWSRSEVDKTFCHQVGQSHRKLMLQALGIDPAIDYPTVDWLGNTGAAALPGALALGIENGHLRPNDRVALLGIGSGINCLMLAVQWRQNLASSRG